jgi:hypothetical protein
MTSNGVALVERNDLEVTFGRVAGSIATLSAMVLVLPFVLLAIGAPLALLVRGVAEVLQWLAGLF